MDAIGKLESQHSEVVRLFREYRLPGEVRDREGIFGKLSEAIATYTEYEGRIFYPAAKARRTAKMLPRFIDEQRRLDRHLAELKKLHPGVGPFDQKLNDLERDIEAHAREQSEELYPQVRAQLGRLGLDKLGEQMERMTREPS